MIYGVAIPDIHYDKLTKYWPDANVRQTNCIRQVLDKAIDNGVKTAFYLGDIAEGVRDSTGNSMRLSEGAQVEFLKLLVDYDSRIKSHIILGGLRPL